MLDALIGQKNAIKILQEDEGRFLFGVIEFRFFSYLVDTYATSNGGYLRKKQYSYITPDYCFCLSAGIKMMETMHSAIGDTAKIIDSWKYDEKIAQNHLKSELNKLKQTIDEAYDNAWVSQFSTQLLSKLSDKVSSITKTISDEFRI